MKKLLLFLIIISSSMSQSVAQKHTRKHPSFRAIDVEYWNTTDSIILSGTLTLPKQAGNRFPAVILISGSGPQDRDYTAFKTVKIFKEIAEYLSARGIAVLRVDDRGTEKKPFRGPGYFNPRIKASLNPLLPDLVRDVQAGITYLKKRRDINHNQIGLLGHSLGGVIAPAVAAQTPVAFIISMGAPLTTGKEFVVQQVIDDLTAENVDSIIINKYIKYLFQPISNLMEKPLLSDEYLKEVVLEITQTARKNLDSLTFAKVGLENISDSNLMIMIAGNITNPITREVISIVTLDYWQRVRCPILALFAAKDRQVNAFIQVPILYRVLEENKIKNYQIAILSGLNHGFREAQTGSMKENQILKKGISPTALQMIHLWLSKTISMKK